MLTCKVQDIQCENTFQCYLSQISFSASRARDQIDGTMCSFFSSSTDAEVTSLRSHRVCLFSVSVNCLFFLVRKDYAFMYDVILLKFCNPLTTEG